MTVDTQTATADNYVAEASRRTHGNNHMQLRTHFQGRRTNYSAAASPEHVRGLHTNTWRRKYGHA